MHVHVMLRTQAAEYHVFYRVRPSSKLSFGTTRREKQVDAPAT